MRAQNRPKAEKQLLRQFGANIRAQREQLVDERDRPLSQEALAANIGLHRTYVSAVERQGPGQEVNVTLVNAAKIAQGLGVSLSELVEGVDYTG